MNNNELIDLFAKKLELQEWQTKMIRKFLRFRTRVILGHQKKIKPLSEKHKIKMLGYRSNFMVIDEFVTADRQKEKKDDHHEISRMG